MSYRTQSENGDSAKDRDLNCWELLVDYGLENPNSELKCRIDTVYTVWRVEHDDEVLFSVVSDETSAKIVVKDVADSSDYPTRAFYQPQSVLVVSLTDGREFAVLGFRKTFDVKRSSMTERKKYYDSLVDSAMKKLTEDERIAVGMSIGLAAHAGDKR